MVIVTIFKGLVALIAVAVVAWTYRFTQYAYHNYYLEEQRVQKRLKLLNQSEGITIGPADLAFERAGELLAVNQIEQAKEKLKFIVNFNPNSWQSREALRIFSEINLDALLDSDNSRGKLTHKVSAGEFYIKIAEKHHTTLDNLIYLNNLNGLETLHPGDELLVMPLHFSLLIEPERKYLTLLENGNFLAGFPILKQRLPRNLTSTIITTIKDKKGFDGVKTWSTRQSHYMHSKKIIALHWKNLQISSIDEKGEVPISSRGFFLQGTHMEEIALLLRAGNKVEIKFSKI